VTRPNEPNPPLPDGVELDSIAIDGEGLLVLSFPTAPMRGRPARPLAPAERAVLVLWLDGLTCGEIAARRGVGIRTVSKQLHAIYRKLGVSSKTELAAKLG